MDAVSFAGIILFLFVQCEAGRLNLPGTESAFFKFLKQTELVNSNTTMEGLYEVLGNELNGGNEVVATVYPLVAQYNAGGDSHLSAFITSYQEMVKILDDLGKADLSVHKIKKVYIKLFQHSPRQLRLEFHCTYILPDALYTNNGAQGNTGARQDLSAQQGKQQTPKCPYEVLGLPKTATGDQIVKKYRKLAMETHPDKFPVDQRQTQEEKMKELNAARDALI